MPAQTESILVLLGTLMRWVSTTVLMVGLVAIGCNDDTPRVAQPAALKEKGTQQLETFATFTGPMPTGVAVSKSGRVFVNFPRWGDPVELTVAEIKNGKAEPFPNLAYNKLNTNEAEKCLVSVQSVVVDDRDSETALPFHS